MAHDPRERRDERAAERRASEELKDEVGDAKRDEVCVELRAGAELVGDGDRADEAKQPATQEPERDDGRRRRQAGGLDGGGLGASRHSSVRNGAPASGIIGDSGSREGPAPCLRVGRIILRAPKREQFAARRPGMLDTTRQPIPCR